MRAVRYSEDMPAKALKPGDAFVRYVRGSLFTYSSYVVLECDGKSIKVRDGTRTGKMVTARGRKVIRTWGLEDGEVVKLILRQQGKFGR